MQYGMMAIPKQRTPPDASWGALRPLVYAIPNSMPPAIAAKQVMPCNIANIALLPPRLVAAI